MYREREGCLDDNDVAAYVDGYAFRPDERARIEEHLAECPFCRELVVGVFQTLVGDQPFIPRKIPQA
jgi:Putative zinc-finger